MRHKKPVYIPLPFLLILLGLSFGQQEASKPGLKIEGLRESVEIIKDRWGISHIFARNQEDLFFAQGFNVASDRLFQLEMWRRQALGLMAEIQGPDALQRDIGARLLKFRGDLKEELSFYHSQSETIISSFVKGINAYIDVVKRNPDLLPLEFRLLGIFPGYWTPEVVVSRHNGLFRNATEEVALAIAVRMAGPEKLKELVDFQPENPDLRAAEGMELNLISDRILKLYEESRSPVRFSPEDIADPTLRRSAPPQKTPELLPCYFFMPQPLTFGISNFSIAKIDGWHGASPQTGRIERRHSEEFFLSILNPPCPLGQSSGALKQISVSENGRRRVGGSLARTEATRRDRTRNSSLGIWDSSDASAASRGSNNWVVSGRLTQSGYPLLANDPHRGLQIPSLRYWVHLVAPGWNVIGAGEPALPGVSIGHNQYGAWGLTIFSADQEDLYVYETNPADPSQYKYQGAWEKMRSVREQIPVKGEKPYEAALKFTRHGPVIYEDIEHRRAYALRAAWLETGCAPYLASLRIDQARSWPEFREACFRNRTPSENMIWADRSGDIGWQATGLTPFRKNWPGLLPVPGEGRYEWSGFIPAQELPSLFNPEAGFIATANQNNLPEGYPYQVGYFWASPFRFNRISEVLGSGRKFSPTDMEALQQDVLSLPARRLFPLLKGLRPQNALAQKSLKLLEDWDCVLSPDSAAAAIYVSWQSAVLANLSQSLMPKDIRDVLGQISLFKAIPWLQAPDSRFGPDPAAARDKLLLESLEQAVESLAKSLGPDIGRWRFGDEKFHHVRLRHPLSAVLREEVRSRLDLGPRPRGGNAETVNMTSGGMNQTSGATFRLIADLSDWDLAVGTNMPGQSGDPDNSHYSDLFSMWVEGRYFPVCFSRPKIESAAEMRILLEPAKNITSREE